MLLRLRTFYTQQSNYFTSGPQIILTPDERHMQYTKQFISKVKIKLKDDNLL